MLGHRHAGANQGLLQLLPARGVEHRLVEPEQRPGQFADRRRHRVKRRIDIDCRVQQQIAAGGPLVAGHRARPEHSGDFSLDQRQRGQQSPLLLDGHCVELAPARRTARPIGPAVRHARLGSVASLRCQRSSQAAALRAVWQENQGGQCAVGSHPKCSLAGSRVNRNGHAASLYRFSRLSLFGLRPY